MLRTLVAHKPERRGVRQFVRFLRGEKNGKSAGGGIAAHGKTGSKKMKKGKELHIKKLRIWVPEGKRGFPKLDLNATREGDNRGKRPTVIIT